MKKVIELRKMKNFPIFTLEMAQKIEDILNDHEKRLLKLEKR